ncbi:MAG TPA: nuclear transport factor 2 family protein [Ktedonobacteraceae bacterium]|nr:nuclear transport factor 2 family protein [Ktedonobacteraceae bacterium]
MNNDQYDFEQFMKQRSEIALAYINGNAAPLGEIVAHQPPATFFKPSGGYRQGAEAVWSQYERDAASFESGGEGQIVILHMAASDGLAYWVGFQQATAHLRGRSGAVPFNLRVTELFRREGDTWKLIHRHADQLLSEPEAKQQ